MPWSGTGHSRAGNGPGSDFWGLGKGNRASPSRMIGATILAKVERGEWPQEKLLAMLDAALTREDDRALFDLTPPVEGYRPVSQ